MCFKRSEVINSCGKVFTLTQIARGVGVTFDPAILKGTSKNCPNPGAALSLMGRTGTGETAMTQMGFFDLSDRYASLDAKKDPLVEIDAVVPWE
ncbi:MAG: hypothetical protein ABJO81_03705, partial [Hyphomicrobiales bacterium]